MLQSSCKWINKADPKPPNIHLHVIVIITFPLLASVLKNQAEFTMMNITLLHDSIRIWVVMLLCAPLTPLHRAALPWGSPPRALFWVLVLDTKCASVSHRRLCVALIWAHSIRIDTCFTAHVSSFYLALSECRADLKRIAHQSHPICISYKSVIDFL